ncbi:hypothetical protein AXF42_Ash004056 [Apostasia shenzhenica]|uniref:Uncharacterized protein n=1 Tax=Apostasia shenzhenica TaxID=1088818 RepID=A0A2I0A1U5_9ASPA|nr:hypothetical protein AXF42_Ash004056 [Apostasia shenzhenica]
MHPLFSLSLSLSLFISFSSLPAQNGSISSNSDHPLFPSMDSENNKSPQTIEEDPKPSSNAGENSSAQANTSLKFHFSLSGIPPWAKLVLGAVVLLGSIPLFRKALRIPDVKKTVEAAKEVVATAAEAMEKVVEAAEKVAEAAEKVAEEVAQVLPEGGFKEAAEKLEEIASLVDHSAEVADAILDKVEDMMEDPDENISKTIIIVDKIH